MKINNALAPAVVETLGPVSKNGRAIGLGTNKTDVSGLLSRGSVYNQGWLWNSSEDVVSHEIHHVTKNQTRHFGIRQLQGVHLICV